MELCGGGVHSNQEHYEEVPQDGGNMHGQEQSVEQALNCSGSVAWAQEEELWDDGLVFFLSHLLCVQYL